MLRNWRGVLALGALLWAVGCGSGRAPMVAATDVQPLPLRDGEWSRAGALDAEAHDATPAERPVGDDEDSQDADGSRRAATVSASAGLSVAGQTSVADEERVDGLSARQFFRAGSRGSTVGGVRSGSAFAEGAIHSLRTMPQSFAADAGGTGVVEAVASRSGLTPWHGDVRGLLRESAWAATNPFSAVTRYRANGVGYSPAGVTTALRKPRDAVGQLGISGGGMVGQRLGVFGSLEQQWRSGVVASAPASATFFTLTATQLALLGNRGVASRQVDGALGYLDGLMGDVARSSSRTLGFARVDGAVSRRDSGWVAWTGNRFSSPAGTQFASASEAVLARGRASVGDEHLAVEGVSGGWAHWIAPRLASETRAQWVSDAESETPRAPLAQEPAIAPGGYAPEVAIAPQGFTYGTPSTLARSAFPDETRTEVVETVAWQRGRHAVSVGGDWSRVEDFVASEPGTAGTFSYDSGTTGGRAGGLVDWVTDNALGVNAYPNAGCPSVTAAVHRFCFRSYRQTFGAQSTQWVTHLFAAYAQDAWRLTDALNVTAGVRWEYELLPVPQQTNAVLDANLQAGLSANDVRAGSTASYPEDRNNFGPRLAVAGRGPLGFDVHAGYGVFFGRIPGATIEAALNQTGLASGVRQVRITPTTETLCPQTPTVSFGYPCAFGGAPPAAVAQTASAMVFAKNFRVPWVQRMNLTLGHAVAPHVRAEVGYSGARATQLPGVMDLNVVPATTTAQFVLQGGDGRVGVRDGTTFALPLYTARLIAQYGPVDALVSSANASYDALTANVRAELPRLSVQASYAWSHADDYSPLPGAAPRRMTQLDPFRNGYDKGRSTLDVTHRLVGSVVMESTWSRGARWERVALSGWRTAAIGSVSSGVPYSYRIFGGTYLSGGGDTINGAGGATYLPTAGRNTLRLPLRAGMDLRVGRTVQFGSRWRGEAFAEAFNVFNTRHVTSVETRAFLVGTAVAGVTPLIFQDAATVAAEGVETPAFGAATSSTSGLSREREVEIGFRLRY